MSDAFEVKAHAMSRLRTLRDEYEDHLTRTWRSAINDVLDAFVEASGNVTKELEKVRAEKVKAARLTADIALFALSFVTAGAMRYLGGIIESRLSKVMSTEIRKRVQIVAKATKVDFGTKGPWDVITEDYPLTLDGTLSEKGLNGIAKNLLGGALALGQWAADNASQKAVGNPPDFSSDFPKEFSDEQVWKLNSELKNALNENQVKATAGISAQVEALENDYANEYGEQKLQQAAGDKVRAKILVDAELENRRNTWVANWLYYGTKPKLLPSADLSRSMEKEMWALWIQRNYHIIKKHCSGEMASHEAEPRGITDQCAGGERIGDVRRNPESGGRVYDYEARVVSEVIHPIVTRRLGTLGIVLAQNEYQRAARAVEDARRKVENDRRKKQNLPPLPERRRANLEVRGAVDEPKELRNLRHWAEHHDVTLVLDRKLPTEPRELKPIGQIYAEYRKD